MMEEIAVLGLSFPPGMQGGVSQRESQIRGKNEKDEQLFTQPEDSRLGVPNLRSSGIFRFLLTMFIHKSSGTA